VKRLVISSRALADLRTIATYIAADNPERAASFVTELRARMDVIAAQPLTFRTRDEWSRGLRSAAHGRYHILFRDFPDRVRVTRVLHGARDIPRLFDTD
jgi:toxin ParE1/3/4